MKKIILLIVLFLFSFAGFSQIATPFEGFESATFPPTTPATWAVFDNGVSAGGANNKNWVALGTPLALINEGLKSAYMDGRQQIGVGNTARDFLASPAVTVATNGQLKFFTRTNTPTPIGTNLQIRVKLVSAGPQNDPTGYEIIQEWNNGSVPQMTVPYSTYQEKTVDFNLTPQYQNVPVYIAFCLENFQEGATTTANRWLVDQVRIVTQCNAPAPTSLTATAILSSSATLGWAAIAGSVGYEIESQPQATAFTGSATSSSTTNSFAQTGLAGSTCYHFRVRTNCGNGNFSAWSGDFLYCTTATPPACGGTFTDSGGPLANYVNNSDITTTITPTPGNQVTVTFTAFNTQLNSDTLKIYDGDSASGVLLGTYSGTTLPPTFTGSSASGALTFVFVSNGSTTASGWIANVTCNPPPACQRPTDFAVTNPTINSVNIAWTNLGAVTSNEVIAIPCTVTTPPTATSVGVPVGASPIVFSTGLLSATCYNFYIRSVCPGSLLSTWTGPISATTLVAPPSCGGQFFDTGGLAGNYQNNENYTVTIPPAIAGQQVTVAFTSFNTEPVLDKLVIYDGTAAGTLLGTYSGTTLPPTFTGSTASGALTFVFTSDGSVVRAGWIANVTCAPPPTCIKPNTLLSSNITTNSATLAWTQPANPNGSFATAWEYVALPSPSVSPTSTTLGTAIGSNPSTIINLAAGSCYDIYIRAVCSTTANDVSFWSTPINFCTLSSPPVCGGNYVDEGGIANNYNASSNVPTVICPTNIGDVVTVTFTAFDTEANWDGIYVYNGNNTNPANLISSGNVAVFGPLAALAGAYWGTIIPGPFTSENPDGCLTFVFKSDGILQRPGWNSVITCGPPDPCKKPKNLATSLVTATTTTLAWTQLPNPDGSISNNWRVIRVACGSPAPTNTSIGWITTPLNPYPFTGLTSETCYDFYVQAVCSPTLSSAIVGPKSATTLIIPPTCGQSFFDLGGQGGTAINGAPNNYLNGSNSTTSICPQSPGQIVTVTFTVFNTEPNFDGLYVFDGPTVNSTQIADPGNGPGFGQLTEAGSYWGTTIPGPFTSTSPDGCLTFNFRSDFSVNRTGWEANVTCSAAPTCSRPYLLNATNTTQTTATLGWTQLPNIGGSTATSWQILVLPAGSPIPTTSGITTTNPYLATGLIPGTAYVFYVRAICSNSDQSIWSSFNFATNPLNDECANATFAVVNQNLACTQTTPGTLAGATGSTQASTCLGTANDDVWFTFTATAPTHIISFNNVVGGTVAGLRYAVFQGNVCGSLTEVGCNSGAGLTPGTTYYVRVYSVAATPQFTTFSLCIGTLPCTEAPAFCTGQTVTYANSTNIPSLGQIGCLFTSPNPAFFFLQVNQAGPLTYLISQQDNNGVGRDVDYVAWGPFTSLETACTGVPASPLPGVIPAPSPADGCPVSGQIHACSYSPDPEEIICIPNAQLCEVYVIMITNFSNQPGTVTFSQSNTGGGTTSCFPINTFEYNRLRYCKNEVPNTVTPILGNGASAGTYSSTPAGLDLDSVTGVITLATSLPGVYTVTSETATVIGGTCSSIPSIITRRTVVIEAPADDTITYDAPARWCQNDPISKLVSKIGTPNGATNGTPNGTYSATPAGLSINPSTGAILPIGSLVGIYNVVYTVAANPAGGCPTYVSPPFQVEILAVPNVIAPNSQNACLNYTLPVLTGDGAYYSLPNGAGTPIPAGTVLTSTQTIYVYATNVNCIAEKQFTITIGTNIIPTTGFTYPISVCKNGINPTPTPVSGFTTGGVYSCTDSNLIFVSTATGEINLSTPPGTYTIKYQVNANTTTCLLLGSTNFDITILPLNTPLNGFNYTSPVCKNGINPTPIVDSGFIGGGVFSCANLLLNINPSTGEINLTSPAGTYTINYKLPASTNIANCYSEVNSSATITINPVITSVSTLTYPLSTACTLGSNMLPSINTIFSSDGVAMTTPPTFPIVITYSVSPVSTVANPGLDINPTTGEINLANSQPGNYVITVTITGNVANCYAGSIKSFNLTVNAPSFQDTFFSYVSPVCKSAIVNPIPVINSTFAAGGFYNSTTLLPSILNPLTGEINLSNAPSGTHDVIYILPSDSVLCLSGGSGIAQITINPVKTPIFTQIPPVCQGTTAPLLPTSSNDTPAITGSWNAAISTTTVGQITYSFAPNAGQCASTTSMDITIVAPNIDPIFAVIPPVCQLAPASQIPALPTVSNNAIAGTWSPSIITSDVVGSKPYIFTPTAGQCAKPLQIFVETKALPIFAITQECKGPSYSLDVVPAYPNAIYEWQISSSLTPNGSSAVVKALGNYTCDVTVNGCTKTVTFIVTNVTCEIQKGISPNGDSLNEEFDLSTLKVKQLNIYNRYGTDVYSKTSYTKEWIGQSNAGEVLPDGTYYYVAELGDGNTKTGWVYINKEN